MIKIKEILEKVYNNKNLRSTVVPLFISNPGQGKSMLIKEFAKEKNVNLVHFITSQRNPMEISGLIMPDRNKNKVSVWDFDTLLNMKDGDILFFDELLNGNTMVLNACLTLLEDRVTISGKKLADIMIVAAANPQGMCPITPQIKERFVWYDLKFEPSTWQDYMSEKYKLPTSISHHLCSLINREDFTGYNFMTPRSIDKAVNMIINDVPTPYESSIKPLLNKFVSNSLETSIELPNGINLAPGENIEWLKLKKLQNETT